MRLALLAGCTFALLAACGPRSKPAETEAPAPAAAAPAPWLEDVRILAADDMQGRDTGSPGGAKARDYVVGRLDRLGVAAPAGGRLQPWTAKGGSDDAGKTFNGVNVLGVIPGTERSDRYIVLTAHYDHLGIAEGQVHNGADDNASGVATLLALAADLEARPPRHGVIVALLDGEEHGLLGAKHLVANPPVPLSAVALNLNFDMTARAETDGKLWAVGTHQHPTLRPPLAAVPAQGPVSFAFGKDTPENKGPDNWVEASDHAVFHRAGVPFLYFGVEYHPDYHKPTDDADKIDAAVFTGATRLSIAGFRALDAGLDR